VFYFVFFSTFTSFAFLLALISEGSVCEYHSKVMVFASPYQWDNFTGK